MRSPRILRLGMLMVFLCVAARAQTSGASGNHRRLDLRLLRRPASGRHRSTRSARACRGPRSARDSKDGTYRLPALPPGRYVIRISRPGFASVEKAVTVVADGVSTFR